MAEESNKKWHELKEASDLEELKSAFQDEDKEEDRTSLDEDDDEDDHDDSKKHKKKSKSSKKEHSALPHPDYEELEEKLTLAEQKAHENWEKATRALAELENVRRRAEREVSNAHRYSIDKLLQALLPVADSLEQALQIAEKDSQMAEGLKLTLKLFLDVLEKQGVTQLNPEGEPFDPKEHEAMTMQEAETAQPNTVLAVFQKGYKLHDRIIRPARVVVAK